MKKRLSIILLLALCAVLLCSGALADEVDEPNYATFLTIGIQKDTGTLSTTQLKAGNYGVVNTDGKLTITEGQPGADLDNYIYYDNSGRLTLKNFTMNCTGNWPGIQTDSANIDLDIYLVGANVINMSNGAAINMPVGPAANNCRIYGDGSLKITTNSTINPAIRVAGNLTIEGAANISIDATAGSYKGIEINNGILEINDATVSVYSNVNAIDVGTYTLNITGNSTVTAVSESQCGINGGLIEIEETADVTAESTDGVTAICAINSSNNEYKDAIIINGNATVTANSYGESNNYDSTIMVNYGRGDVAIMGSAKVTANSRGISLSADNVIISENATVEVTTNNFYGIFAWENISIGDNTEVKAKGDFPGIYATDNLSITGGEVYSESSDSAAIYSELGSMNFSNAHITLKGQSALYQLPELAYTNGYLWRTDAEANMTASANEPYRYSPEYTYTEFMPFVEGTNVAGIALNTGELTFTIGDRVQTAQLVATVSPETATNQSVTWVSSNPEVATVSANGLVTAVSPGTAVITVTAADGGWTATCTVTVRPRQVNLPDTYDIELVTSDGGEASLSLNNSSEGATITVTAIPDEGYELDYITVNGERISGTSFTMPDHDVTVRVYFREIGATLPFTDVNSGAWYYDAVSYVYTNGLMDGVSDTQFDPNGNMTRAMVWAILARMDGERVTGSNWAETAQAWAVASGVSDGENASGLVTREELATMLWRYAGEATSSYSLSAFSDASSVSDWAATAMAWAVENGAITGVSEGVLAPAGGANRAQCAAMLMRFDTLV